MVCSRGKPRCRQSFPEPRAGELSCNKFPLQKFCQVFLLTGFLFLPSVCSGEPSIYFLEQIWFRKWGTGGKGTLHTGFLG